MNHTARLAHTLRRLALRLALAVLAVAALASLVGPLYADPAPSAPVLAPASATLVDIPAPVDPDHVASAQEHGDCHARGLAMFEDYTCAEPTTVVVYGLVSDAMWEDLRAQGYRGNPSDGMEALYVPSEVAADACRTDLDCMVYGR